MTTREESRARLRELDGVSSDEMRTGRDTPDEEIGPLDEPGGKPLITERSRAELDG